MQTSNLSHFQRLQIHNKYVVTENGALLVPGDLSPAIAVLCL